MGLKEFIEKRKLKNEMEHILCGLYIESTEDFSWAITIQDSEIFMDSRKYAGMLYKIIENAKNNNDVDTFKVLQQVIERYGEWKERPRRGASRGPGCYGIQLTMPNEVKEKIDNLYEKFLQNKKMKDQKLIENIDNIVIK